MISTRTFTKTANMLLAISVIVLAIMKGLAFFAGDGAQAKPFLQRVQRLFGLLPTSYRFGKCVVPVPADFFILSAQYKKDGFIWKLGLIPTLASQPSAGGSFHILSTRIKSPELVIEWLTSEQQKNIEKGKKNCTDSGSCVLVQDAFGSGKTGIQIGEGLPVILLVPDLGISVTSYHKPVDWFRCSD